MRPHAPTSRAGARETARCRLDERSDATHFQKAQPYVQGGLQVALRQAEEVGK